MSQKIDRCLPNPLGLRLPWVVAEAGQTMGGDIDLAVRMVELFARAGCWGFKVQLLTPELIASKDAQAYWSTTRYAATQRESFARAGVIAYEDWGPVVDRCRELGLQWFCSAFDRRAVETAHAKYRPSVWKVASGDVNNFPLLRDVKATGAPVVLSTGGARPWEVEQAVELLRPSPVVLLACTLAYPTPDADAHLGRIGELIDFSRPLDNVCGVGYSDHTLGTWAAAAATYGRAVMLEKHARPDVADGEIPDLDMALIPHQMRIYVETARTARARVVPSAIEPTPVEEAAVKGARRSLFAARAMAAGDEILEGDVIPLRPSDPAGIPPDRVDDVIGATAVEPIGEGELIRPEAIRKPGKLF